VLRVRYTVWAPNALDALDRAGFTQQQRAFVDGLLRALEPGTYLTEHVVGANSAVLALIRAYHALDGHVRQNQPRWELTTTVLAQALEDVKTAGPAYSVSPTGAQIITRAQQVLTTVVTAMRPGGPQPSHTDKENFARQIDALVPDAQAAARAAVEVLWGSPELPEGVANRIRGEAAVLVTLRGRDGIALRTALNKRLKHQGPLDAVGLTDVLWPVKRPYQVLVIVSGAQTLEHLDLLLDGARQSPFPAQGLPADFAGSPPLRSLVLAARPSGERAVLVQVNELAADAQTAIDSGRRRVTETLDRYAAGQRLVDLRLSPRSVATNSDGVSVAFDVLVGGGRVARPLTAHRNEFLRPAMRMANLAKQVEAPVATVALSWSAIESLRLNKDDFELIAKACALQSLRQQMLSTYKSITDSANARLRQAQWRVERSLKLLDQAERGHATASRGQSPASKHAATVLAEKASNLRAASADTESQRQLLISELMSHVDVVRRVLLGGGVPGQPLSMTSWKMKDLNLFLDSLLPPRATDSADQRQLRTAVAELAQAGGGLAAELFVTWQARLANPMVLLSWLDEQQHFFHGLLSWMYAARNLAFHAGQFTVPADVLTAQASRSLVDMVLEFLGNWHKDEHSRNEQDSEARDILEDLAARKEALTAALANAQSCHPLNVDSVTAPGGGCWDRL
jgi:hypothetical protein